jgi:phage tail sheath protein FI
MKAFLITPFSAERAGHEPDADFSAVQQAIAQATERAGLELVHPARMHQPGFVVEQIETSLMNADVVVAVITGQNPNVFYEIGYARRPAILVCRSPADVPFDLGHLRYWTYGRPGELATLADRLTMAIRESLAMPTDSASRRIPRRPEPSLVKREMTAAFVGCVERGPATLMVTSFAEYVTAFGRPLDGSITFLASAVRGFFDNGGRRACVARVVTPEATIASVHRQCEQNRSLTIRARSCGGWGNQIEVTIRPGTRIGVRVTVACHAGSEEPEREDFDNLSPAGKGPNPLVERINADSRLVFVESDATSLPTDLDVWLAGGADGSRPSVADYLSAYAALDDGHEIDVVCVPDHVHPAFSEEEQHKLADAIVESCRSRIERFALLATPGGLHESERLKPRYDTTDAAMYYPWVSSPLIAGFVPPIGHVAGAFARNDAEIGVHAAPIGVALDGISSCGFEMQTTAAMRDSLGRLGINALAEDSSGRPQIETAWNLAIDDRSRHLNVVRFRSFVAHAIQNGLAWTVFEPNGEALWRRVTEQITRFLQQLWDCGVLSGERPEEAFFVRCDTTTMTADDIDNGRLVIVCGVAMAGPPVSFFIDLTLGTASGSTFG